MLSRDDFKKLISETRDGLDLELIEDLTTKLYPMFEGLDFQGKSLFVQVKTEGQPPDVLNRLYAYADWLRHYGAKNVVFLPKEAEVSVHELSESKTVVMRFLGKMPEVDKLNEYADWFRIAGADPKKVIFLPAEETVDVEKQGGI